VRTCVSNRDTDLPIQKVLHAVGVLCIDYYEACQRKDRANSWNDCHSRVEVRSVSTASAEKNMLGFRARASRISSLAPGRGGPRYCGGQQRAKRIENENGRPSPVPYPCPYIPARPGRPSVTATEGLGPRELRIELKQFAGASPAPHATATATATGGLYLLYVLVLVLVLGSRHPFRDFVVVVVVIGPPFSVLRSSAIWHLKTRSAVGRARARGRRPVRLPRRPRQLR
jgi:hypothetical protein